MRVTIRWMAPLTVALCVAPIGCDESTDSDDDEPAKTKTKSRNKTTDYKKKGRSLATDSASATTAPRVVKFVRERPSMQQTGVDACAYIGFLGMACLDAIIAEKNPVARRFMRRLSDADARLAKDAFDGGERGGMAHAETALFCAESGACGQTGPDGAKMDEGYSCLTKAEGLLREGDKVTSKAAHARACKCDPKRAQIPVMGGFLACDGPDQPVDRSARLKSAEAKDVRACGECDHVAGPAACNREMERLSASDKELADYIATMHIPRCAKR